MDINKLVRMANQIAANFDYGKDPEKATAATADHLRRFWSPEMRREIIAYYREGSNGQPDGAELSLIAGRAVARLAEEEQKVVA